MPAGPWSRWSLARKVPLVTATTLVVALGLMLLITYQALRSAREETLFERVRSVSRQVTSGSEASLRTRINLLRDVGRDTTLRRAVLAGRVTAADSGAVHAALRRVVLPVDSALPVELLDIRGNRLAMIGTPLPDDRRGTLAPELRPFNGPARGLVGSGVTSDDSVQTGALYQSGGRVYFWSLIPVMDGTRRLGYVAQQRRVSNTAQAMRTVRALIGDGVAVTVRNSTDEFGTSLEGDPIAKRAPRDTADRGFRSHVPGRGDMLGAEAHVTGSPWLFVVEMPASIAHQESLATVRRLALSALLLLIPAVLVAWLLGRRITRPLVELTSAAESIARGDVARRIPVELTDGEGDEIGRLGASFNRMAAQVETSQAALAEQVTEAQEMAEELEHANVQLRRTSELAESARGMAEHANRAKSDFLAVMSHELRTPLNAIGGYTQILQMGVYGALTEQQQDALRRIERSQQALLSLINDVLNFAKLEAGEVRYAITRVPVAALLAGLEPLVAPQLRERNLSYSLAPIPDGLAVCADRDKTQQIVINLLSNAIKFTNPGGSIHVSALEADGAVHVRVRDTGIGIATDRLPFIFDPFVQVGRALSAPHDGVGLGLSISRDLAVAMGGTLRAESTLGAGSMFVLSLPVDVPS